MQEARPYNILWDVTSSCNYSCKHCSAAQFASGSMKELSLNEIRQVVSNLKTDRPIGITFCGGEPLFREDFNQIVDLLQDSLNIASISSFTNGSMLKAVGRDLLERDVCLLVSLDGITAESNDKIRGDGSFNKTIDNLIWIIQEKEANSGLQGSISLSYTITSECCTATELLKFANELGIARLSITPVFEAGNTIENRWVLPSNTQLINFTEQMLVAQFQSNVNVSMDFIKPLFIKYVNHKYGLNLPYKYHGCKAVTSDFIIRPDGTVVPCRGIYPNTSIYQRLGIPNMDLCTNNINQILSHEAFARICALKNPGNYPMYFPCSECDFAGTYCDPCWIENHLSKRVNMALCAYAKEVLEQ